MGAPLALEVAEIAPQAVPVQPLPESAQVTPLFARSFNTVAYTCCVPPGATVAVMGTTPTEITAVPLIVMVAEADFVPSEAEVAVSVTLAGLGTVAGAE